MVDGSMKCACNVHFISETSSLEIELCFGHLLSTVVIDLLCLSACCTMGVINSWSFVVSTIECEIWNQQDLTLDIMEWGVYFVRLPCEHLYCLNFFDELLYLCWVMMDIIFVDAHIHEDSPSDWPCLIFVGQKDRGWLDILDEEAHGKGEGKAWNAERWTSNFIV